MSKLVKREFDVLVPNSLNYLSWSLGAEILLSGKGLLKTILPKSTDAKPIEVENAQARHFLRHHLSTTLKSEYMTERNPLALWNSLRARFEKIESVLLPKVECEWQNVRFQYFKIIEEYNTILYGIVTRMKLCGKEIEDKDLIHKTLSTFHPKLTYGSRQYRKENYKTYVELSNALQQDQGEDEICRIICLVPLAQQHRLKLMLLHSRRTIKGKIKRNLSGTVKAKPKNSGRIRKARKSLNWVRAVNKTKIVSSVK